MEKESSQWWISLYNTLFLLGINKTRIDLLESDLFDPLDELEAAIDLGFSDDAINYFVEKEWISLDLKNEIKKFKSFIDKIPAKNWNYLDYENNEDWHLIKKWARHLFEKLNFKDYGWNDQGSVVIFTDTP